MRYAWILLVLLATGSVLLGQHLPSSPGSSSATVRLHEPARPSWDMFNQRHGTMNVLASGDFAGSSLTFLTRGGGNLLYGLNLNLLAMPIRSEFSNIGNNQAISEYALMMPLWLTFKYRLLNNPYARFSPYLAAGAGPTLAFKFRDPANRAYNTSSRLESYLGGGGFIGAGVDMLWLEDWALSADVRYHVIEYDRAVGLSEEYRGVSFSVGFMRAFGK